jgi:hypothetical protein
MTRNKQTAVTLRSIDARTLQAGMRFTAPLFFDDGVNLFAAQGQPFNDFHLRAIKNWNIAVLLTSGELDDSGEPEELEELEELESSGESGE